MLWLHNHARTAPACAVQANVDLCTRFMHDHLAVDRRIQHHEQDASGITDEGEVSCALTEDSKCMIKCCVWRIALFLAWSAAVHEYD